MNAKTYSLKYGRIEKLPVLENGKQKEVDGKPILEDKFVHEGTLTTRSGLKINEATLEPEFVSLSSLPRLGGGVEDSKTLEGKAFILFDVDEQKEVKSGTL